MRRAVYVDKDTQKAIVNAFLRVKGRSVLGNKHCSALKDIEENIAKMRSEKGKKVKIEV